MLIFEFEVYLIRKLPEIYQTKYLIHFLLEHTLKYKVRGSVGTSSIGSTQPVNYQRRILIVVNFWAYWKVLDILALYLHKKWFIFLIVVWNPLIQNFCRAPENKIYMAIHGILLQRKNWTNIKSRTESQFAERILNKITKPFNFTG